MGFHFLMCWCVKTCSQPINRLKKNVIKAGVPYENYSNICKCPIENENVKKCSNCIL